MLTATLRAMIAHKLRLVLTTASIALGVAFLAGTLVLTDTMGLAFEQLFGKVSAGTDAVVRTEAPYTAVGGRRHQPGTDRRVGPRPTSPSVDGVRAAEGSVSGYALLTDNDGKADPHQRWRTHHGLQHAGRREASAATSTCCSGTRPGRAGRGRHRRHQRRGATTSRSARTIKVLFQGPTQEFTVVGTVGFGGEKNLGGTTSAYFDTATAQKRPRHARLLRRDRRERRRRREPGRAGQAAQRRRARRRRGGHRRRPSRRRTPTRSRRTSRSSGILFMIFAGIALFVGSFIIWNTFTMIVTQRSREIALLRAIGATRRQVMRSLLLEALLLGVAASADRHRARHRRRQGPQRC